MTKENPQESMIILGRAIDLQNNIYMSAETSKLKDTILSNIKTLCESS